MRSSDKPKEQGHLPQRPAHSRRSFLQDLRDLLASLSKRRRLQLLLLCRRIYNRAKEDEPKKDEAKEGEKTGEWLQNLIQVMTYRELCQRRRENRSMRRKYY